MPDQIELIAQMALAAIAPMINDRVAEAGTEVGKRARALVESTENTFDDTALESVAVFLEATVAEIRNPATSPA